MQAQMEVQDPSSPEYQRVRWDALRKSINGLINKVNVGNIKFIVPEVSDCCWFTFAKKIRNCTIAHFQSPWNTALWRELD
jgi:hypothetical protein